MQETMPAHHPRNGCGMHPDWRRRTTSILTCRWPPKRKGRSRAQLPGEKPCGRCRPRRDWTALRSVHTRSLRRFCGQGFADPLDSDNVAGLRCSQWSNVTTAVSSDTISALEAGLSCHHISIISMLVFSNRCYFASHR
jgi:hypothetical protein